MSEVAPTRSVAIRDIAPLLLTAAVLWLWFQPTPTHALSYELTQVLTGQGDVVAITHAGDERLFLVSKEGRVFIFRNGVREPAPYLDIRSRVLFTGEPESEQGLLSVVFHPDYQANGFLFAAYTRFDGTGVVSRFSVTGPNPDQASLGSERLLLEVPQPGPNHNLNHLAFGPDGYLYISSGDGGYQPEPRCTPQEGDNLLGKILRLDVDSNIDSPPYHRIPADNPFVGDPDVLDEIWGLGLRNPWRFTFDSVTGDLWLADVGHRTREEINFLASGTPGGQNWGFKMMEGFFCRGSMDGCSEPIPPCFSPAYTEPILDYGQDGRHCAVIGGPVYRGASIPQLQGAFLAGDYCGATFLVRQVGQSFVRTDLSEDVFGLVTFGEDSSGEVYLLAEGTLYRLVGVREDVTVGFTETELTVSESAGVARVMVRRQGDTTSAVSVRVRTTPLTAGAGDFQATTVTVAWGIGETANRFVEIPVFDDAELEGNERFQVELFSPEGAELAAQSTLQVVIVDDDIGGTCVPTDTALCLGGEGRFRVTLVWEDFEGNTGVGHAVPLDAVTDNPAAVSSSGLIWFFGPDNMEMLVKVLDACTFNGYHWVFLAAATTVDYTVEILDSQTGEVWTYRNPLGTASPATTDVQAFSCL
ncbi:MAG: PQQ-dependent sugar dehydrogenase [Thermoanaerobaculia bacterium]|nr:PQQ-dependent sugar dehydrogenase [Thermoanaerobaculia bacterium]